MDNFVNLRGSDINPFYRSRRNFAHESRPQCTLACEISSGSVYSVAPLRGKPPNCPHFQLRHPVVAPNISWSNNIKTTSPTPFAQSHSLKLCRSRMWRTDRQTDKNSTFWLSRRRAKSEHGDRGPRARSSTYKRFRVRPIVSPLRGRSIFESNRTTTNLLPEQLRNPLAESPRILTRDPARGASTISENYVKIVQGMRRCDRATRLYFKIW